MERYSRISIEEIKKGKFMRIDDGIHESEVQNFVDDVLNNARVELVTAESEKNELYRLAAKKGIIAKGSYDIGLFKTIYAFPDKPNTNGEILQEKNFLKVFPTIVMKPVTKAHLGNTQEDWELYKGKDRPVTILGVYFDYKYIAKTKTAIVYGIFFKSIYPQYWQQMQKYIKKGQLKSSYELWYDMDKVEELPDGSKKLWIIEMAGGALLLDDPILYPDQAPASPDARVLAIAKKLEKNVKMGMIIASELKQSEVNETPVSEESEEQSPVKPNRIPFKCACLECGMPLQEGVIKSISKRVATVECQCGAEFELGFAKAKANILRDLPFLISARVACPQCNGAVDYTYFNQHEKGEKVVKCSKCGLKFPVANPTEVDRFAVDEIKEIKTSKENKNLKLASASFREDDEMKKLNYVVLRQAAEKIRQLRGSIKIASEESHTAMAIASKSKDLQRNKIRRAIKKFLSVSEKLKVTLDELENVKKDSEAKVQLYKDNAKTLLDRRNELGEDFIIAHEITDEQLADKREFTIAKLTKQLEEKEDKSEVDEDSTEEKPIEVNLAVATKVQSTGFGYYGDPKVRAEIDSMWDDDPTLNLERE